MSQTTPRPLPAARRVYADLYRHLGGLFDRVEVAGSVRRARQMVGDIEIVAQASTSRHELPLLTALKSGLFQQTAWDHADKWGPKYKSFKFQDFKIDLFIVTPPAQWGVLFLIRTGPGDANMVLVNKTARGGLLPDNMQFQEGQLWHNEQPLHTPEEVDVFRAVGLAYIPPERRSPIAYRYARRIPPVINYLPDYTPPPVVDQPRLL